MFTFIILVSGYLLSQFFRAFLAVIAGDLTRDLGLGAAQLGSLSAVWLCAFAIAQIPLGTALDRVGPRRSASVTMVLAVVGALIFALTPNFAGALVAMALLGAGCAPVLMTGFYMLARTYPPERFAFLCSLLIGIGTMGDPLSATPLALMVAKIGWRNSMLVMAAFTALVTAAYALFLRDPPPAPAHRRASFASALHAVASIRAIWPILPITFVSYGVLISIRGLWIGPYLADAHRFGTTDLGHAAFLMGFAIALGALGYGVLDRIFGHTKRLVAGGMALTAIAYLALGLWGNASAGLAVALLGLIGVAGSSYSLIMAHGRVFIPTHYLGQGVTFMNFLFMGGAGLIQWLSGVFVQQAHHAGAATAQIFSWLFVSFGVILGLAILIYAFAPATAAEAEGRSA